MLTLQITSAMLDSPFEPVSTSKNIGVLRTELCLPNGGRMRYEVDLELYNGPSRFYISGQEIKRMRSNSDILEALLKVVGARNYADTQGKVVRVIYTVTPKGEKEIIGIGNIFYPEYFMCQTSDLLDFRRMIIPWNFSIGWEWEA